MSKEELRKSIYQAMVDAQKAGLTDYDIIDELTFDYTLNSLLNVAAHILKRISVDYRQYNCIGEVTLFAGVVEGVR